MTCVFAGGNSNGSTSRVKLYGSSAPVVEVSVWDRLQSKYVCSNDNTTNTKHLTVGSTRCQN